MKLTELDGDTLDTYLATLKPDGSTYHDIGMIWGGRLISPTGIFAGENGDVSDNQPTNRNLIFLTDGETAPSDISYSSYGIEPLDQLPPDVAIGGHLVAEQDGDEVIWRITDIADGKAVLDGNHELAGQRLRFDCKVLDIRPATQEEITHGHVHGAHGHHH